MMKRVEIAFFALFVMLPFLFLNYGKWLDTTEKPVKSDIVFCLGGGTYLRLIKSKELYDAGYTKNPVLLLGEAGYNERYAKKHFPNLPTITDESPKNTAEEVKFIKRYMRENNYKSALIVTDPTHSRRVKLLLSIISVSGVRGMRFHIISSDVKWWNAECYWCNKRSWTLVKSESIRILYTLIFSWGYRYGRMAGD